MAPLRPLRDRAAAAPGLLLAGLGLMVLTALRPSLVRSSLTNARAWLLVAVLVALALGLPPLLRRLGAAPRLARGLALLPTVIALVAVLVPSFRTRTLDEPLPAAFAVPAAAAAPTPRSPSAAPPAPAPAPTAAASVAESSPPPAPAPPPAPPAAPAPPPAPPAAPAPPAPPAAPVVTVVAAGSLRGLDHAAEGGLRVLEADGQRVLAFEEVRIESAPDHQVYLVPGAGRRSPGEGSVHLGSLKAERGSFSYAVPAGFDTSGEFTVLLWCGRFTSPNGHASLA